MIYKPSCPYFDTLLFSAWKVCAQIVTASKLAVENSCLIFKEFEGYNSNDKKEECVDKDKLKKFGHDLTYGIDDNGHIFLCFAEEGKYFDNGDTAEILVDKAVAKRKEGQHGYDSYCKAYHIAFASSKKAFSREVYAFDQASEDDFEDVDPEANIFECR